MTRTQALELVSRERDRQNKLWVREDGKWDEPDTLKLTVLVEEVGEVARAVLQTDGDDENLRDELVQVAGVCISWLEML